MQIGLNAESEGQPDLKRYEPVLLDREGRWAEARQIEAETLVPIPPYPTSAFPGSARKLMTMKFRAIQGQQIFHPDDALRDTE